MTPQQIAILEALDIPAYRNMLLQNGADANRLARADDFTMLASMHKVRYSSRQVADRFREQSRLFLALNQMQGVNGEPLLPIGQLPE